MFKRLFLLNFHRLSQIQLLYSCFTISGSFVSCFVYQLMHIDTWFMSHIHTCVHGSLITWDFSLLLRWCLYSMSMLFAAAAPSTTSSDSLKPPLKNKAFSTKLYSITICINGQFLDIMVCDWIVYYVFLLWSVAAMLLANPGPYWNKVACCFGNSS